MQMAGEYFLIANLDVVVSSPPCKSSGTDKPLLRGRMRSAQKPAEMFLQRAFRRLTVMIRLHLSFLHSCYWLHLQLTNDISL